MGDNWNDAKEVAHELRPYFWFIALAWSALMIYLAWAQFAGEYVLVWGAGFAYLAAGALFVAWKRKRDTLNYVVEQVRGHAEAVRARAEVGGIESSERKAWAIDRLLIKCAGVRCSLEIFIRDEIAAGRPLAVPGELVCMLRGKPYEKPHWFLQIEMTQEWVNDVRDFVTQAFGPTTAQTLVPETVPHALDGMQEMVGNYRRALENLQRGLKYQPPDFPGL